MSLFLDALRKKNNSRPPVWLMRQAGRYMPCYQEIRQQYTLSQCFHSPELAAQITLQPITHLGVDAAILFSDILLILETLNLSVIYPPQGAPYIEGTIHDNGASTLPYVVQTIKQVSSSLPVPLIGFAGGPLTVASYMIRKKGEEPLQAIERALRENPPLLHAYLEKITAKTISYLESQLHAGASALQIFDSWAGLLPPPLFQTFAVPYLDKIIQALQGAPLILFTRNAKAHLDTLVSLHPSALSLDWEADLAQTHARYPVALQGNLDPAILLESPDTIVKKTHEMLHKMKGSNRYIANLGHGVLPQTPVEHVKLFVDTVKSFS